MMYLQVAVGFVLLLGGAEALVRGAVALARRWNVPPLIIGMTIVAFGTSASELVVTVEAALEGRSGLALGNVIGSNIANVLLIVGATAAVMPIAARRRPLIHDTAVLLVGTALFVGLIMQGEIATGRGLLLLLAFATFLGLSYWRGVRGYGNGTAASLVHEAQEIGTLGSVWVSAAAVVIGLGALLFGGEQLVAGGTAIARSLGVSEAVIGLTLIAVGTSLPELAASVVAGIRGHPDVAIGNVIGSNLFNILGVAGAAALAAPLSVDPQIRGFDVWAMAGATVLLVPFLLGYLRVGRRTALVFLGLYALFIALQATGAAPMLFDVGQSGTAPGVLNPSIQAATLPG